MMTIQWPPPLGAETGPSQSHEAEGAKGSQLGV